MQDVAEHNTSSDIYMVVHDKVYDCTKFLDEHPYVILSPTSALRGVALRSRMHDILT